MAVDRPFGLLESAKGILLGALIITVLGSVCSGGEWSFVPQASWVLARGELDSEQPIYAPTQAETPFTPTPSPTPHPGGWDFTLDPANPVVVAEAGTWQDHFVYLHAVEVNDNYYLYYSAEEVSTKGRIGLATSEDGSLFHRGDTWVLDNGPSGAFDSWIVSVPRASWNPGQGMRLWYLGYTGCCPYGQAIGEADAPDGIEFTRHPSNPQWDHSGVGDYMLGGACVLLDPDEPNALLRYKQYSGIYDDGVTQIGLIASPDGVNWTWRGYVLEVGQPGEWDAGGVANPTVLKYEEGYLMLYVCPVGNDRLGIALSLDGVNWVRYPYNPLPPVERKVRETTALIEDNVLHLWYLTAFKGTVVHHAWSVIPDGLFDVEFPTPAPTATPTPTLPPTSTPTPTLTPTPTPMPFAVNLFAHIDPTEPRTLDDLECVTEVENLGGYPELFLSYRWFRDGVELVDPLEVGGEIFPVTESVLSHHFTAKNETFHCVARVTDGTGSVEATTDAVTILNSPPTAPEIVILPENPTPDDGLAVWFVVGSEDPDGDLVLPVFEWFESSDGENWRRRGELSGNVDPYSKGQNEISHLYTQMAEYWRVVVTPVEFEGVGKPADVLAAAELGALEVVQAGGSAADEVYILPDLNGDDRVDGEDLLVLRSVWHQRKSDLNPLLKDVFFERTQSETSQVGVAHLFRMAAKGWYEGNGE